MRRILILFATALLLSLVPATAVDAGGPPLVMCPVQNIFITPKGQIVCQGPR